jgi:DUF4097 and DUF4098 domain-containing protein YvlB
MFNRALFIAAVLVLLALVPQVSDLRGVLAQDAEQNRAAEPEQSAPVWSEPIGGGDEVREEFAQTYPLSAAGKVIVENLNGSVKIKVWDRNEVEVKAVKRAYNRERLAEAKIDVVAAADVIRIKTIYPQGQQTFSDDEKVRYFNPAAVDYSLTVPRKAKLESIELVNGSLDIEGTEGDVKASSVNGKVTARGLTGEARLSSVNGNLDIILTRLDQSKPISAGSVNGNVTLEIPSNANAVIRAGTVHGSIKNDFGLEVHHGNYVGHELNGQIGTGGPSIKLGNVNGAIQIKRSQDGLELSPATSLLSQKDKTKSKEKDLEVDVDDEEAAEVQAETRQLAEEVRRATRAALADAQIERQAQAEAQREVDRALREAHREIRQAQLQVAREVRQREQRARTEARSKGTGYGVGSGHGSGGRFTAKESKSFPVTGTPRVQISTFDGVLVIRGWDKPEVMYTAHSKANSEEELKDISVNVEQDGSSISIIARSVEDGNGSSNLEVYLPRNVFLTASSGDGQLTVAGVSGELTLRTGDGAIEVTSVSGTLRANTGDGPIKIAQFDGAVDARTGDGPISLDGKFAGLAARTGSGSIILAVPAGSSFVLETNADDFTNEGLSLSEELSPSRRVKRWKVGQGGKVFVVSTGEGRVWLRQRN